MKRWWAGLSERDRRILRIGALLLVPILIYAFLWVPLDRSRDALRRTAEATDANLQWMRAAAADLGRLQGQVQAAGPADSRSLLARVDASAREAGLAGSLLRVEPVGEGQVRVQFQQAGFDGLAAWLETLTRRYPIVVDELSVQRSSGVGQVDARVGLVER